jgi:hypothetical protein
MSPLRLEHVLRKDLKDGQSKTGLARQTDGWKFAHQYRAGVKNKVVRIPRQSENFTSVSEEHGLGRAEQIFAVNANYQNDLMRCAQEKMAERAQPSQKGWDEKKKILQSCWLIEEVNGDYFCDCYEGIRGRMCEHTVGMHFRQNTGRITATEQVRSLPIAAKRKAGRPKKLPASCLTKSPVKVTRPAEPALDVTTEELVPVVTVVAGLGLGRSGAGAEGHPQQQAAFAPPRPAVHLRPLQLLPCRLQQQHGRPHGYGRGPAHHAEVGGGAGRKQPATWCIVATVHQSV